jgi:UDP-N-acetylglucosamine 1-carboxyvinyltransferase
LAFISSFWKGYTKPGGDKIGRRRLDTFRRFYKPRGKIPLQQRRSLYGVEAKNGLVGTAMLLDEASVTGTANIVMAAVLAKGTTTVYNAACEPCSNM